MMWSDLAAIGGFAFLLAMWWLQSRLYKRLHGVAAKWWAIPFCNGALLWSQRLPGEWEKKQ